MFIGSKVFKNPKPKKAYSFQIETLEEEFERLAFFFVNHYILMIFLCGLTLLYCGVFLLL